jgi:hypothetical protein
MEASRVGLCWDTIAPIGDTWRCCVCRGADYTKIIIECDGVTHDRMHCHIGHAAFGLDEKLALIRDTLVHYQYMKVNWRKHIGRWLDGVCRKIIEEDYD